MYNAESFQRKVFTNLYRPVRIANTFILNVGAHAKKTALRAIFSLKSRKFGQFSGELRYNRVIR